MEGSECPPVTVEGDWTPAQTKALKTKLHIYFQSKKKSSGGDCRVEAEEGAPRAAVYFSSPEVRERVLSRKNHEIILGSKTIQLRLSSEASPTSSDRVSDSKTPQAEPGSGAAAASKEDSESSQSCAVVLENVIDNMSTDLLSMLVENISGLDENGYSMERILESNKAVVTFSSPADVERFLSVSQTSTKMKKHGLTAGPLKVATNIRVESLPPTVVKVLSTSLPLPWKSLTVCSLKPKRGTMDLINWSLNAIETLFSTRSLGLGEPIEDIYLFGTMITDQRWLGPGLSKNKESRNSCSNPHKAARCVDWNDGASRGFSEWAH